MVGARLSAGGVWGWWGWFGVCVGVGGKATTLHALAAVTWMVGVAVG